MVAFVKASRIFFRRSPDVFVGLEQSEPDKISDIIEILQGDASTIDLFATVSLIAEAYRAQILHIITRVLLTTHWTRAAPLEPFLQTRTVKFVSTVKRGCGFFSVERHRANDAVFRGRGETSREPLQEFAACWK
jgi:hypothetical protein